ncbi:MAG: hypothetical protein C0609_01235 [Deltaproteobacteria bacterium]|nr:MAG: hypothetical protein C0609_01235 [Deltaproteobacteria bacterium]
MFDSHIHLNSDIFFNDLDAVVEKMTLAGVTGAAIGGYNESSSRRAVMVNERYPKMLATAGFHPLFLEGDELSDEFALFLETAEIAAIGEIGLDFWGGRDDEARQRKFFETQAIIAKERALPIVLHIRKSFYETLSLLDSTGFKGPALHHAFSGSADMAEKALERGHYLSVGGKITYPERDKLRELFSTVPKERLLVETDAPDIPIFKRRGEPHRPTDLLDIIAALSEVIGLTPEETAKLTEENAKSFFGCKG